MAIDWYKAGAAPKTSIIRQPEFSTYSRAAPRPYETTCPKQIVTELMVTRVPNGVALDR